MNHKCFDVDRRHDVPVQQLTRYARREAWEMDPQDFAVQIALMFGRGQIDDSREIWVALNTLICHRPVAAPRNRWEAEARPGWIRVVLPDDDGVVDVSDSMAATVSVSPSGAVVFDSGNHLDHFVSVADLGELCGFYGELASRCAGVLQ